MKMKIIIHLSNFNCHFHVQVNCNSHVDVSGQPHLVSVILVLCLPTCNILSSAQVIVFPRENFSLSQRLRYFSYDMERDSPHRHCTEAGS